MNSAEDVLVEAVEVRKVSRSEVATLYASAMASGEPVDWQRVNKAIIGRWSLGALEGIKRKAHKLRKGSMSGLFPTDPDDGKGRGPYSAGP